jgi:PAS domain S-box-containing protein
MMQINVLFVSNDQTQLDLFMKVVEIKKLRYNVISVTGPYELDTVVLSDFDIVLANYWLENGTVLELLPLLRDIPCIVMTDPGSEAHIQQVINQGAQDFLIKDEEQKYLSLVPILVRKALMHRDVEDTNYDMLKTSEKRYEDLVQALPDIVYKLNPSGHFTFVNNSIRTLGYEPEELIGKHFSILLESNQVESVSRQTVIESYHGKVTGDNEAPKLFDERRSGHRKTTSLKIRLKKNPTHQKSFEDKEMIGSIISYGEVSATGQYRTDREKRYFTGTIGIIRDITTREKSERMLHRLSLAVEQSPVSIIIFNRQGITEYINPFFIQASGYFPDELIGKSILTLRTDETSDDTYTIIKDTLFGGNSWKGNLPYRSHKGESVMNRVLISPVMDCNQEITDFIIIGEQIESAG